MRKFPSTRKIRKQPRHLLKQVPGLEFREMPLADICCGSAGIYNVLHTEMSMDILQRKMSNVNASKAEVIATAAGNGESGGGGAELGPAVAG